MLDWISNLMPLVLACLAGALGWLAWRRRGLRAAGVCACGYALTGNSSGVCPECGRAAEEGLVASERSRLVVAAWRLVYWQAAVVIGGALLVGGVVRLMGERVWADCRVVLKPQERLYGQVEMLWRVRQPGGGGGSGGSGGGGGGGGAGGTVPGVELRMTTLTGRDESRVFSPGPEVAREVRAWVSERMPAGSERAGGEAGEELGALVERAAGGAQVVLVGGAGVHHAVLANGVVLSAERPRWATVLALVGVAGAAVWGGRAVVRRAMA